MLNSTLKNIQLRLLFFRYFSGGPSPALNAQIFFLGESKKFEKFWAWGLVPAGGLSGAVWVAFKHKKGVSPNISFLVGRGGRGDHQTGSRTHISLLWSRRQFRRSRGGSCRGVERSNRRTPIARPPACFPSREPD